MRLLYLFIIYYVVVFNNRLYGIGFSFMKPYVCLLLLESIGNLLWHQLSINKVEIRIKIPPCESVFSQHALWLHNVLVFANLDNNNNGSPCDFGSKIVQNDKLEPIFFEGHMALDILQDIICSYKNNNHARKHVFAKNRVAFVLNYAFVKMYELQQWPCRISRQSWWHR